MQTDINNMVYGENKNPYVESAKSGVTGGFGYYVGDKTTKGLGGVAGETLLPAIFWKHLWSNFIGVVECYYCRLSDSSNDKDKK